MKILRTKKHQIEFLIDDEDEESVSQYTWFSPKDRNGEDSYPSTNIRVYFNDVCLTRTVLRLHEFIMGKAPKGKQWDHIDRNPLNNQRENFRLVTPLGQAHNRRIRKDNKTGCQGVSKTRYDMFCSDIIINKETFNLGIFKTLEEAMAARRTVQEKIVEYEKKQD